MMAAFLRTFLPSALFFAHAAILEIPRLTMLEAGWEKGRLRREVMRCSRSRLFFLPSFPSPSTSESARRRLKGRLLGRDGADMGRSKVNLREGPAQKVKVKVSFLAVSLLSQRICTMPTGVLVRVLDPDGPRYVNLKALLNGRLHLLHEEEHLEALAHLSNRPGVTCAALAAEVFISSKCGG